MDEGGVCADGRGESCGRRGRSVSRRSSVRGREEGVGRAGVGERMDGGGARRRRTYLYLYLALAWRAGVARVGRRHGCGARATTPQRAHAILRRFSALLRCAARACVGSFSDRCARWRVVSDMTASASLSVARPLWQPCRSHEQLPARKRHSIQRHLFFHDGGLLDPFLVP